MLEWGVVVEAGGGLIDGGKDVLKEETFVEAVGLG